MTKRSSSSSTYKKHRWSRGRGWWAVGCGAPAAGHSSSSGRSGSNSNSSSTSSRTQQRHCRQLARTQTRTNAAVATATFRAQAVGADMLLQVADLREGMGGEGLGRALQN